MRLKACTRNGFFFVAILGTLSHFFYGWFGKNFLIGLVSPVNESTFEHLKLLFFPALFYFPLLLHCLKEEYPNIAYAFTLGIFFGILLIPLIFYSYTAVLGKHLLVLDILTFFLSVAGTFWLTRRLADFPFSPFGKKVLVTALFFMVLVFFLVSFWLQK